MTHRSWRSPRTHPRTQERPGDPALRYDSALFARKRTLASASMLAIVSWCSSARATYSIAAFDHASGRFGGATASCVPLDVLRMVYASVPGEGAVLTQSYLLPDGVARTLALEALAEGQSAAEILAALTDPAFDPDWQLRQYAVLDPIGEVASFTGSMAEPFASDLRRSHGPFELVVAGNFLSGEETLFAAAQAFEQGCDLEARLMNALVAASAQGRGDARCVVQGVPAQAARIQVERADDDLELEVGLDAPPPDDPVAMLAEQFDAWRSVHPCPVAEAASAPSPPPARGGGCAATGARAPGRGWPTFLATLLAGLIARRRPATLRAGRHPSFE